ncbi:MAG TPA: tripartite tricarboxylate transporter substrate binding protein [Burkholderiales bacterium]|nr:tripartite tricarboxylate transporter substrate binding protein [Burkholderiales bacterium]
MRLLLLLLLFACHAAAQPYPSKPIRIVNGAPPGTPGDVAARIVAEPLSVRLGQPVVVENRPGAINTIALAAVAKSPADGHTLGVLGMPSSVAPSLMPAMPYDTVRDLAPVRQLSWVSNVLVVRPGSSFASVAELVAAARARPGDLTYASGGNGTPAHLAAVLFSQRAGIELRHVPYKGVVAGLGALLGEQVDMMIAVAPAALPQVRAGKLLALATPAPSRLTSLPEVRTLAELGYAVDVRDWHGIVAPRGTPRAVIERLEQALAAVLAQDDVKERLARVGLEPAESSADAFASHIRAEVLKWARVVSDAGIKAD